MRYCILLLLMAAQAMGAYLRQSTATTIQIGPFFDSTDGVTPETALTISQADVKLSKAGAAFAAKSDATAATHDADGWYRVPLAAADTATLGTLKISVQESGACPWWATYTVVPANVYDSIIAGTDGLQVDTTQIGGRTPYEATGVVYGAVSTAVSATVFDVDAADFGGGASPSAITAYTGHTLQMTSGGSAGESHVITNTLWDGSTMRFTVRTGFQVAPSAGDTFTITPNRIDTVWAYNQTGEAIATAASITALNDPTAASIADAVWDETLAAHAGAGSAGAALSSAGSAADAATIADAVWDEARTDHTASGSFGEQVNIDLSVDANAADEIADAVFAYQVESNPAGGYWTFLQLWRQLCSIDLGDTTEVGNRTTFFGVDDSTVRVVGESYDTGRNVTTRNGD